MVENLLSVGVLLLRATLAAVLITAGSAKLADTRGFASTLTGLGLSLRPPYVAHGLAIAIPLLEVGLGLAVVAGVWPTLVNLGILVITCAFSLAVCVALRMAPHVQCRCFGALSDSQFSMKGLARSLLLTAAAAVVFMSGSHPSLHVGRSWPVEGLLVAAYLLFGIGVAQAAGTIARLKARMNP